MVTKQVAIATAKNVLRQTKVRLQDVSKQADFDIIVNGGYRVLVEYGGLSDARNKVVKGLESGVADVVAYVTFKLGVAPIVFWGYMDGEDLMVLASVGSIFNEPKTLKKGAIHKEMVLSGELWYTPAEIARGGLLGKLGAREIKGLINDKVLKATIAGQGRRKRYWVKGENLIKYLAEQDEKAG